MPAVKKLGVAATGQNHPGRSSCASFDPSIDGGAELRAFMTEHYHQPSDNASLPWGFGW